MAKQFSLAYLTVLGCPPDEMIEIAARTGYDFVSLRPIYMGLPGEPNYSLADNKELMQKTKRALSDTGIKLLDIELARIYDGVDPKRYLPSMEAAAELGGRHVLSSIWTDDRNFAVERFAELCDLAKPLGLTVELEFVPIASVSTLAGVLDVLHTVKRDNAGVMLDMHHFHRSGDKVEDLDAIPREWFRFFHLCDAPVEIPTAKEEMTRILREARLYVGEGGIDIASVVNRIPEIPYSIELPNTKRSQELGYEEFARRCLESAKAYFEKHPRTNQESLSTNKKKLIEV
ncbi:sugar phosphate isomerase/epimerase family protein [Brevibacillus invocatus]|uniref:sugar phosphate isomerase/epimerase family protein n=1 Tax=Brevibacillus invocatus TaxID=173959 RepID=UPI00203E8B0A|nr:sugar phosphate isomerase/epimerase [Brevibacillus invocatus]MCM3428553.1 sugar phosphate isomerase/epimerase [Brevibacillus invocatus]